MRLCDHPILSSYMRGPHTGWSENLRVTDVSGNDVTASVLDGRRPIHSELDRVSAPFLVYLRMMEIEICGLVLLGSKDSPSFLANDFSRAQPRFKMRSSMGRQATGEQGAVIVRDIEEPDAPWIIDDLELFSDLFRPWRIDGGVIIYGMPTGLPLPAVELPAEISVVTSAGELLRSDSDHYLTYSRKNIRPSEEGIWSFGLVRKRKLLQLRSR